MQQKKQFPLWVSHTSINDFLSCPRAYFLRNVYKDPKTGKKINIINPAIALGLSVHETLEVLATINADERLKKPLLEVFETNWSQVSGKLGGFTDEQEEAFFKERGRRMIKRVIDSPGPIANKALRLHSPDELPPRFTLSSDHNIILCGKVDWLEYFPEDDSVHIIDFKTGTHEESADSLQLPIYALLVKNCQKRVIKKMSYWYLERDNTPIEVGIPNLDQAHERVLETALQVKKAREERIFVCPRNGCFSCHPFENIIAGKATYIKTSGYQDIYSN